jgi:hypothetical protein
MNQGADGQPRSDGFDGELQRAFSRTQSELDRLRALNKRIQELVDTLNRPPIDPALLREYERVVAEWRQVSDRFVAGKEALLGMMNLNDGSGARGQVE